MITIQNKRYPKLLKEIGKEMPKQLYYKGEWLESTDIFDNCLAVVGSRRMTSYGKRVTEQIITEIAAAGITIVSGFMYGIDATAHKAVVRAGGRTIAVMPCGINLIHPEYQGDLYNEILDNKGLIVSEYEGDMQPVLWTYPQRNRIVAGLSQAVLVIEAGEKSGSLITANWAKKFKRKIFAVPGPITSAVSKGTLQLIKEGAEIATCAKDILKFYRVENNFLKSSPPNTQASRASEASQGKALLFSSMRMLAKREREDLSSPSKDSDAFQKIQGSNLEQKIIEYLQGEPLGVDELSRLLEISVSELGVTLSIMQLRGLISQEGTKYYTDN